MQKDIHTLENIQHQAAR